MLNQSLSLSHLVRPPKSNLDTTPPLLVLMHGVGSNEEDLFSLANELDDRFLIVSSRAPIAIGPGAFGWFSIDIQQGRLLFNEEEAIKSLNIIDRFIDELITEYHADRSRVFLMGFSQGAIMSIGTLLLHPEKVAGAVVMSGCLLPNIADKDQNMLRLKNAAKRRPVIVCHGKWDDILPIELGRRLHDYLESLPVDCEYHEYQMAHQVSYESLTDIKNWFSKQL